MNQNQKRKATAVKELGFISILALIIFLLAARFEAFERFSAWALVHDNWQLDDAAVAFFVLAWAAYIFSWRRWRELRIEVTRRERAEDSLRKSESSYRQIIEQANELIYKTDVKGRFTFCNPTVSKLLKDSEGELIGRHYLEVVRPEERPGLKGSTANKSFVAPPRPIENCQSWPKTGRNS